MKSEIIRELGEGSILLPSLIREGLAANDRIKVRMSALQAAAQHAERPGTPVTDLSVESRAAGLAAAALASLIEGAHAAGDARFAAPHLAELIQDLGEDTATMIRAVAAGEPKDGEAANDARCNPRRRAAHTLPGDRDRARRGLDRAQEGRDSLHRLVMDLHKSLNHLRRGLCGGRRRRRPCVRPRSAGPRRGRSFHGRLEPDRAPEVRPSRARHDGDARWAAGS